MPLRHFSPRDPSRFGIQPVVVSTTPTDGPLDSGITLGVPTPPGKLVVLRASCYTIVVPASAGGAVTATIEKYDASADATVALTAAFDLEALVASERSEITILSTLTEAQRTLDDGDTLRVVIAAGTVETEPDELSFTIELGYRE